MSALQKECTEPFLLRRISEKLKKATEMGMGKEKQMERETERKKKEKISAGEKALLRARQLDAEAARLRSSFEIQRALTALNQGPTLVSN